MIIKLIIAIDQNGLMGINNKLPWKLRDDLKQFKKETANSPLIMGANTFNSLPGILPNREHLVLSNTLFGDNDKSVFTSIKEALEYCKESNYEQAFVIGGAHLIKQFSFLNLFDELIITHVDCFLEGDTYLDLEEDLKIDNWDCYSETKIDKSDVNEYSFTIKKYIRKKKRFF